jgi:hypothetical protein
MSRRPPAGTIVSPDDRILTNPEVEETFNKSMLNSIMLTMGKKMTQYIKLVNDLANARIAISSQYLDEIQKQCVKNLEEVYEKSLVRHRVTDHNRLQAMQQILDFEKSCQEVSPPVQAIRLDFSRKLFSAIAIYRAPIAEGQDANELKKTLYGKIKVACDTYTRQMHAITSKPENAEPSAQRQRHSE